MEKIVPQIIENFTKEVMKIFSNEGNLKIKDVEEKLLSESKSFVCKAMEAYLEIINESILAEKEERKELGLTVHKREVPREVLTRCGAINFNRTYYKNNLKEGYEYILDKVVGIESGERISGTVAAEIATKSAEMSYLKSSKEVTGGKITKQTVSNKIRKLKPLETKIPESKREIKILHIAADEDHVAMQEGKSVIVPLITVHEGIKRICKGRNSCINATHFSRYGIKTEELWEEVYAWIDESYRLENIERIYIHGDGASWIKVGLEKMPNSKFVLDGYHIEKYIRGITGGDKKEYDRKIHQAIWNCNQEEIETIASDMLSEASDKQEVSRILEFKKYIINNWEGIEIKRIEPQCGGSCTEGQVSHVLSARLSSRPIGWSEEGLKHMSELRVYVVNGGTICSENFIKKGEVVELRELQKRAIIKAKEVFENAKDYSIFEKKENDFGKVTPLFRMFRGIKNSGYIV